MFRTTSILILVTLASSAAAQPTGAQAETLFKDAQVLMSRGKYTEACAAFEASQKLDPSTVTVVNLAHCREKNLQLASAWGWYLQAERELRSATDAANTQLREDVKRRAAALEPRLSKLTINVLSENQVVGLEIIRDNAHVDAGAWNHALPVDGGTIKVSARAPDRREWTTMVNLRTEGDAQVVDVPALGERTAPPIIPPSPSQRPSSTRSSRRLPLALGATALGLGIGAIGFSLWGNLIYDDAKVATDRDRQGELWHSANTRRYLGTAFGIAAVGTAGAAIYLYVKRRGSERPARTAVAPVVTGGSVGISLDTQW